MDLRKTLSPSPPPHQTDAETADLGSDWALVVWLEPDGGWERVWIGGEVPTRAGHALDDFGTAYSSLSALQRFPIERLKIDRSFVSGVGENKRDEALTSAIVALAKSLDQRVVAEGVETESQAQFLTALACDELQGYLFGRPLAPEEFEAYLSRELKAEVARPEGAR